MTATDLPATPSLPQPPEADVQFDVGATENSLERMTDLAARFGDIYRVYAPGRKSYTWVINHPEDVKRVLVGNHRNYTKGTGLDRVKILLGNGLMTSEGDFWRRQRYMMQPLFHRRVVTGFNELIDAANARFIDKWAAQAARGESVNLTEDMSELTLEIVLGSIFGKDLAVLTQQPGGNPFAVVTKETARDLKFAYQFRLLGKQVAALMAKRRTEPAEHFDYLSMLMNARDKESGEPMSERALIDEVMTLVVAGHETTASGLNWAWYLLAKHPEVDARMHAEIEATPELTAPGLGAMEALQYTQNVINEALRLYPPGWILSRRSLEPDVLCGFQIPAGTDVLLSPYLLHRHPQYWKEPDAFRPERFDSEHETERPRFAYIPFAAGPRHCIGESLALYEMLMHLYKVARHYRLTLASDEPIELEAQINLRTRKPLVMRLERR
ncbi:MAG TPA: cytochrome P450 [Steroidobacteraceae bacterium]|jgi:cytochrome P450|nr:cytochrome P450 [Steroidobacteraceae bacterium]